MRSRQSCAATRSACSGWVLNVEHQRVDSRGTALERSLDVIRAAFHADGYEMTVERLGPDLAVRVQAGEGACDECLIPKHLVRDMVAKATGYDSAMITVEYPTDT